MEIKEGLCKSVQDEGLVMRLLDGELDASGEDTVLAHLRVCPDCLSLAAKVMYMDSRISEIIADKKQDSPGLSKADVGDAREKKPDSHGKGFKIEVDKLPIGKALDRDLLDEGGNLLVAAGTSLSTAIIDSLKRRGIEKLSIQEIEPEIKSIPGIERPPQSINIRDLEDIVFESGLEPALSLAVKNRAIEAIRDSFKSIEESGYFNLREVEESAIEATNEVLRRPQVSLTLADIELNDTSLYTHSMNVFVTFLAISRAMGHPAQLIRDHATAAMLHDVGRMVLRRTDISVGRKHTVEEEDREHTEAGYTYLWNMGGIGETALKMVMNHHERYDGNGYPRKLKGTNLTDWDQILILANTYDNLTWDRSNGIRSGFHEALSTLIQESGRYVRKGIIRAVLQTVGHYPPGSWVRMNTGEVGIVTRAHPGSPMKPLVTVVYDEAGERLARRKKIDLSHAQNAYIKGSASIRTVA